ncbi:hypothetical protein GCM10008961_18910 [Deinococcus knuensis]|uniref:Uncharacterized protein n=1 Tax=Deinococcus knuensis TaxID=1837380 RepID=A0ABQ2SJP6_9DEIO|nr:hypothetical protein GCM10008961_18910 [Deinococcus knuensis]
MGAWRRASPPPSPLPQGGRGSNVALGKSFYWRGGGVSGGDVSGLDAILPPPRKARALRARRPVVVCGGWLGALLNAADRL